VIVKLDADTLSTVPAAPPAAGPERALDPPPPGANCLDAAGANVAAVVVPALLPALALTMPYAPPPIATAVAPIAIDLVNFRENMPRPFVVFASTMRPRAESELKGVQQVLVNLHEVLLRARWIGSMNA
jgi:hypothetical protein